MKELRWMLINPDGTFALLYLTSRYHQHPRTG